MSKRDPVSQAKTTLADLQRRCEHGYFDAHCTPHGLGSHFGVVACEGGCRGAPFATAQDLVDALRELGAEDWIGHPNDNKPGTYLVFPLSKIEEQL